MELEYPPAFTKLGGKPGMAQGADGARRAEDQLAGLRERLIEEYGTRVPTDAIDRAARQSLGEFEDARIRDFVGVFAWRRARRRLADRTLP